MKKTLFILIFTLFASAICNSQGISNWTRQIPVEYDLNFQGICCSDTSTAFGFGNNGKILRTNDGGDTWVSINSNTNNQLFSMCFANDSIGFCVGLNGTILKTIDNGQTWTAFQHECGQTLNSVHFFNDSIGCIVGSNSTILWTNDQGETWTQQVSPILFDIQEVHLVSPESSIAVGPNSSIIKTNNGGASWETIDFPYTNVNLINVDFSTESKGLVTGGEYGYVTENFGTSWVKIEMSNDNVNDIQFIDSTHGYATARWWYPGHFGINFLTTNDGGYTWQWELEIVSNLFCMADTSIGYSILQNNYNIYKTENSGSSFTTCFSNTPKDLNSVHFQDSLAGCAVGVNGEIVSTIDAGNIWHVRECPINTNLNSVFCYDNSNWYAVGDTGVIIKSTDNGTTWVEQYSNTESNLNTVFFSHANIGIAIGDDGTVLRTTNEGSTWQEVNIESTERLHDGLFVNDSVGYICSYSSVYKTTDFGISWIRINNNALNNSYSVYFTSPLVGYINSNEELLKTTNGGLNWEISYQNLYDIGSADCIKFFDESFGIFATNGGAMSGTTGAISTWGYTFVTTDGGENWNQYNVEGIKSISFTNAKYAFLVGKLGIIYKIDFETANYIDRTTELPTLIYPNPNKGEFIINLNSNSTVEAYSHSGQLVFKEELEKGEHNINLTHLPPAMYILKVNSGTLYQKYKVIIAE